MGKKVSVVAALFGALMVGALFGPTIVDAQGQPPETGVPAMPVVIVEPSPLPIEGTVVATMAPSVPVPFSVSAYAEIDVGNEVIASVTVDTPNGEAFVVERVYVSRQTRTVAAIRSTTVELGDLSVPIPVEFVGPGDSFEKNYTGNMDLPWVLQDGDPIRLIGVAGPIGREIPQDARVTVVGHLAE